LKIKHFLRAEKNILKNGNYEKSEKLTSYFNNGLRFEFYILEIEYISTQYSRRAPAFDAKH
jgi:hypothetical protein